MIRWLRALVHEWELPFYQRPVVDGPLCFFTVIVAPVDTVIVVVGAIPAFVRGPEYSPENLLST